MVGPDCRVSLIAGGSGGIGRAVARELSAAGTLVYVGFKRGAEAARQVAAEIAAGGGRAETVDLDLLDPGAPDTVCREIHDRHGRLDILVNCAAVNREAAAVGMIDADWNEVLEINLHGAFRLSRAAAKYMLLGRWGRIVNVSSIAANCGGRGQINYAAAKAGVEALTRVLALELGRKGVLVNGIAPGIIETSLSARIRAEHGEELKSAIALRRFGQPEEVARLASFLASDAASYITGQVIRIDGGMAL